MLSFAGIGGISSPALEILALVLVAFLAGLVGGLVGVGGGLFIVPALVLLFGVEIHLAIAASLVSIVATSTGTAAARLKEGLVNIRLGMFLETATATGGLLGAIVSVTLLAEHGNVLFFALVPVLLVGAGLMGSGRRKEAFARRPPDPWAERLGLSGAVVDPVTGLREEYRVSGTSKGLAFSALAGLTSGLLGVGGGIFKVPGMNAFMNVPLRVASATSALMIGVTASAGAIVYLFAGDVAVGLAVPVVLSVLAGSYLSTHVSAAWPVRRLRLLMVIVLLVAAVLIFLRGAGWLT